ncbi:MAG: RadC family protein [Breznakia sp.]
MKLKEMTISERPREKAFYHGVESLSNVELLAILLRCGSRGKSALDIASEVIAQVDGILHLQTSSILELSKIYGMSKLKAVELHAAFELSKRISFEALRSTVSIDNPLTLSTYLNKKIGFKEQEHFHVLFLNNKNEIICDKTMFIGTLNMSVVHPRDIFKEAMQKNTAKIVISHNHPSGDCIPSEQDILVTSTIEQVGKLVGIPLLDHLVVSHNAYFSFRKEKILK